MYMSESRPNLLRDDSALILLLSYCSHEHEHPLVDVLIFITSPLGMDVGPWSLYIGLFTNVSCVFFDSTTTVEIGKVGPVNRFTTTVVGISY